MCRRAVCPNDGKPTWWGCGGHIEQALEGVPEADRCTCQHTPVPGNERMQEVKRADGDGAAPAVAVGMDDDGRLAQAAKEVGEARGI